MLSFFRSGGAAQLIIGAIVFAIIVVFVVEFRKGNKADGSLSIQCAAKVRGYCVHQKEFEANAQLASGGAIENAKLRQEVRRLALEGLVERELLFAQGEKLGLAVSDQELNEELFDGRVRVSLPAATPDNIYAQLWLCPALPSPFERRSVYCAPEGPRGVRMLPVKSTKTQRFDYDLYERSVRMQTNRSPKEFKQMQRRELVAERLREMVRSWARVSEGEVWTAYESRESKVVVRYAELQRDWFMKYVVQAADGQVDDWAKANPEQVTRAWDAVKGQWAANCPLVSEILVRVPADATNEDKVILREKIESAAKRLETGEPFAQVAREQSEGATALSGGDLGCLTESGYGKGASELLEAATDLKTDEVSPVIETELGFHLLLGQGKVPAGEEEVLGRRHVARGLAIRFMADGLAKKFAEQLIEKVKAGSSLETATTELAAAALSEAKGGASAKQKEGEALPGLDAPDKPKVTLSPPTSRQGSPILGAAPGVEVAKMAFALATPGTLHPAPIDLVGGYAVMELKEKKVASRDTFAKERGELMRKRARAKGQEALVAYIKELRSAAQNRIEVDTSLYATKDAEEDAPGAPQEEPDAP